MIQTPSPTKDPASAGWFDGFNNQPKASRDPVYLEFYREGEVDADEAEYDSHEDEPEAEAWD